MLRRAAMLVHSLSIRQNVLQIEKVQSVNTGSNPSGQMSNAF